MDIPVLGDDAKGNLCSGFGTLVSNRMDLMSNNGNYNCNVDANQMETLNVNALLLLQKSLSATQKRLRVCTVFLIHLCFNNVTHVIQLDD